VVLRPSVVLLDVPPLLAVTVTVEPVLAVLDTVPLVEPPVPAAVLVTVAAPEVDEFVTAPLPVALVELELLDGSPSPDSVASGTGPCVQAYTQSTLARASRAV
jgi:hypothetical protein